MIVTVFRSRLRPGSREEYIALVDRMVELAKTIPGYISHKGFLPKTASGLPLSNSSTKRGCVPGARTPNIEPRRKGLGKIYYSEYSVQVCNVVRESKFQLDERVPA